LSCGGEMGVKADFNNAMSLLPIIKDKIADEFNSNVPGNLPSLDLEKGNLVVIEYIPVMFRTILNHYIPNVQANVWVENEKGRRKTKLTIIRESFMKGNRIKITKCLTGYFKCANAYIYDEKTINLLFNEFNFSEKLMKKIKKVICIVSCNNMKYCTVYSD
jgi:hypothetical protein